jgi:hypothetical protein
MAAINAEGFSELVDATVTAVSILGGAMAYTSGFAATQGLIERCDPAELAERINVGIARGFLVGAPVSALTLIIEGWA